MTQSDWKPFHESIIPRIEDMTIHEGDNLSKLIKTTRIPANWDAIADAWDKRMKEIYPPSAFAWIEDGVRQSLMEQKAKVEKDFDDSRKQTEFERENGVITG